MDNIDHGLMYRMHLFTATEKKDVDFRHRSSYLRELEYIGEGQTFGDHDDQFEEIRGGEDPSWPVGKRGQTLFPHHEEELTTMLQNMGILKSENEFKKPRFSL
jgi:hypothetical protein